jgi:hypothetical protein
MGRAMADGSHEARPAAPLPSVETVALVVALVLGRLGEGGPPQVAGFARLVTPAEAAAILGVTVKHLKDWRWKGGGPAFVRISHKVVMYRYESLMAWACKREFESAHAERLAG